MIRIGRIGLAVVAVLVVLMTGLAHAGFYSGAVTLADGTAAVLVELTPSDGSVRGAGLLGGRVYTIDGQVSGPVTVRDQQGALVGVGTIDVPTLTLFGVVIPSDEQGPPVLRVLFPDGTSASLWRW